MVFSPTTLAIILIALFFYYLLPCWQRHILAAGSAAFVLLWQPTYLAVFLAIIAFSYYWAMLIESADGQKRLIYLWAGIAVIFLCYVPLKYLFRADTAGHFKGTGDALIYAIGVAFYSLQIVGYFSDIYNRRVHAERRFLNYFLFIALFTKLLSGPIERAGDLMNQFDKRVEFSAGDLRSGALLFLFGLFKKFVVAGVIVEILAPVFSQPQDHSGLTLLVAAMLSRYFLFCDLSGYTDMARGASRLFGLRLTENFNRPFFSKNILEFWRRWHMSLAFWIRDYIFFPLATSGLRKLGLPALIVLSFIFLGLWHEATWAFLIYGIIQGVLVVGHHGIAQRMKISVWAPIQIVFTFVVVVSLPTVLFFTPDLDTAMDFYLRIFGIGAGSQNWLSLTLPWGLSNPRFVHSLVFISMIEFVQFVQKKVGVLSILDRWNFSFRWLAYAALIVLILRYGNFELASGFIYSRF